MNKTTNELNTTDEISQRNIDCSLMGVSESQKEDFEVLVGEVRDSFSHYLRKRPVIATSLVFFAGFYVGWKIKPW